MTETRGKSHKEEEIRSTFNDQNICSADKDTSFAIHQYHPENLLHKYCSERKLTIYKIHEILTGHQQKKKKKEKEKTNTKIIVTRRSGNRKQIRCKNPFLQRLEIPIPLKLEYPPQYAPKRYGPMCSNSVYILRKSGTYRPSKLI